MKRYGLFLFLISCFLLLTIFSCDKTPVGYDELERDVSTPVLNAFYPSSHFCYGKYVPLGGADYMVLGKNNEYESRILIQFPIDTLTISDITSLKLVIYPKNYNSISFSIYSIMKISEWQEGSVIWNRAYEGQPWINSGGDYYPRLLANVSLTADSCVIPIAINQGLLDSLKNYSNGIILIPNTSNGFASINSKNITSKTPKIIVEYGSTTKSFAPSQDAHIIKAINLNPNSNDDAWLGSGYPFRTMMKFNLDTIPDNVTIAYAELILPRNSYFSMSDTFDIGIWKVLEPYFASITSYANDRFAQSQYIASSDTVIIFDLRKIVQFWTINPDSNFGILVSCYPENYEISRVQLKTGSAGPYLKVGYIKPPTGRF